VKTDPRAEQLRWARRQRGVARWAWAGLVVGGVAGVIAYAPAAWLAGALATASGQRLLLADARGTVWAGSAVPVLTGGEGSRDAAALPGRLSWTLGWHGGGLQVQAMQACCINGALSLRLTPGINRLRIDWLPPSGALAVNQPGAQAGTAPAAGPSVIGQWPAGWLVGLGTPWNTLQPGGLLSVASPGLMLETVQGRWRLTGGLDIELRGTSSRISTLPILGSYRLGIAGNAASGEAASLSLSTLDGALQLSGSGQWSAASLRFRGEAHAAEGAEAALDNLLNIIGRRQGARAVISIG
jgi:general secretion pathway protein N